MKEMRSIVGMPCQNYLTGIQDFLHVLVIKDIFIYQIMFEDFLLAMSVPQPNFLYLSWRIGLVGLLTLSLTLDLCWHIRVFLHVQKFWVIIGLSTSN